MKNNVTVLEWPPNSPDLSPIENSWSEMWRQAVRMKPGTEDELWNEAKKAWDDLETEYIDRLVMSFRRRLELCVLTGGKSINGLR